MKKPLNKSSLFRIAPILFLLFLLFPLLGFSKNDNQKTVLYVSSFSEDSYWSQESKKALMTKFNDEKYSIKLLELYLDEEIIPELDARIKIVKNYFANLKEKVDVIVVFDYGATNVFLTYTDSIISKIPIVFVSELDTKREYNFKNITGIISDYGIAQTYKLGLKMFPNTKKVYVWGDKSPTGIFFAEQARNTLIGYNDGIKIEYGLDVNSKEELLQKCKNLDPNSFIIFSTWSIDKKGRKYSDSELIHIFFKAIKVPIFCIYDELIGSGFIGGFVQSPKENGKAAAVKAIRIFNGEFTDRMVTEYITPIPIFDFNKIIEKGGNTKVIPSNSILKNEYKGYIYSYRYIILLLVIILIIILVVIIEKKKNNKLKKKIIGKDKKEKKLEQSIKLLSIAMPTLKVMSWSYNERTQKFKFGIANNDGLMESIQEGDIDFVKSYLSPEQMEKLLSFFNSIKDIDNQHEFHIEFYGIIPGEENNSWWESSGIINIIEDDDGKYRVVNGMIVNIDKYKQIEFRLNKALEKSIQSDKLKSSFISNITHEIRTPLHAIIGFSNLIIKSDNDEEKQEYIKIIQDNNDNLLNIVNDIIDLSEIESGFLKMKRIQFDLKQYYDEIESLFKHKLKDGVEFIIDIPHKSCIVLLDKVRLIQIFKIFIDNAIKFTNKGYIKIGYSVVDNGIRFYCEDTGIGIKKENLTKIFDHFEKSDSFEQGTGLGLTIAKSIMDIIGAKYGVESEEGKGSTFWGWIPSKLIILDDKNEKDNNIEVGNDIEMETKILVVDEDDCSRKLLGAIFKKNYNIAFAKRGLEAVEKVTKEMPDIIIMDLKMQDINGCEVIKRIKQNNNDIPIIVVSTKVLTHEKREAFEAGCNEFIEKPIDNELLFAVIENIRNKHH
ncbi:MAG: response regulator [Bacteroidales bacterium]